MPVLCRRLKSKDHAASDFESESLLISLLLGVFVKNLTNASGKKHTRPRKNPQLRL